MAEILFTEQKNGYDKMQVDNYVQMLTKSYQKAYAEYLDISGKYNDLVQEYKKLEAEKSEKADKSAGIDADLIAKTLLSSERLAKEIIDNAYNEEARMVAQTKKNLDQAYKTIGKAITEAQKFLISRSDEQPEETAGGINLPYELNFELQKQ